MNVLHFIPSMAAVAESRILQYKLGLIGSMAENACVHVLTSDKTDFPGDKVVVHKYRSALFFAGGKRSGFDKLLTASAPDIVHIHASWNLLAFIVQRKCMKRRIPVVISVDKQLAPWHVSRNYFTCKFPFKIAAQRYMLRNAEALHAVNEQEKINLLHFGWYPGAMPKRILNDKICIVEPFSFVKYASSRDMSDSLMRLYKKVADSNPFFYMSKEDVFAEDTLMWFGMIKEYLEDIPSEETFLRLSSLGNDSWRRILLHSADEGISDFIKDGANTCNIALPSVEEADVDRFRDSVPSEEDIKEKVYSSYKIRKLMSDKSLSGVERDVCVALVAALFKIRKSYIHRADLSELYRLLRFSDYNETQVCHKIRGVHLSKRVARLFQILLERYGLEEGFMFMEPLNDRGTERLRKILFKANIQ